MTLSTGSRGGRSRTGAPAHDPGDLCTPYFKPHPVLSTCFLYLCRGSPKPPQVWWVTTRTRKTQTRTHSRERGPHGPAGGGGRMRLPGLQAPLGEFLE